MADYINKPSRSYRTDRGNSGHDHDEDPLVELARIVSDDGTFFRSTPAQPVNLPESGTGPDPFSADLEAELMEQFEASFAGEATGAVDIAYAEEPYRAPEAESESEYADYTAGDSPAPSAMADAADTQSEAVISADFERSEAYEATAANDRFERFDPAGQAGTYLSDDIRGHPAVEPVQDAYRAAPDDAIAGAAAGLPRPNAFEIEFAEALAETDSPQFTEDFTPEFGVEAYGRNPEFQDNRASGDGFVDHGSDYPASRYAGAASDGEMDDAYQDRMAMLPPVTARAGGRKGLIAVVGVLAVVVLGGGVATYIGNSAPNDPATPAPVIRAEGGDVKVMADATDTAGTEPSVLDQLAGLQAKSEEKLIDRTEEPQQIARVVLPGPGNENSAQIAKSVGEQAEEPSGSVTDAIAKTIDRVMQQPAQPAATPKFDPIGPRKVRTVVVKPDGSIVSDDDSAALARRSLPIPPVPAPAAVETMTVASENSTQSPKPTPVKTTEITSAPARGDAMSGASQPVQPRQIVTGEPMAPVIDTGEALQAMAAPTDAIPRSRPANAPDTVVARARFSQATQLAARSTNEPVNLLAAPAETAQPRGTASTAPVSTGAISPATGQGGYVVQVSSQRSADQAQASFASMQRRYNSVLGGFEANIQRADLGEKGTYYRVRIGPMANRESAVQLCEQLKSAGGSCFVTR